MQSFVVLSQQRSGSHMLMNLLNSHSAIHCNSDLMTADIESHGEDWAWRQGLRLPEGVEAERVGFLLKIKQNLHAGLRQQQGLKILFLQRRNRLATLLSKHVGSQLGLYEDPKKGISLDEARARRAAMPPQRIPFKEAKRFFEEWASRTDEVLGCLEGTDWMGVFYEDL